MSGTFNSTIDGGPGNDLSSGTSGDDWILGGDGNDTLAGMAGNDSIFGGNDNDYINGADGADTLLGGGGNDLFFDAAGADLYDGGVGADTVVFSGGIQNYTIEYASTGSGSNYSLNASVRASNAGADGLSDIVQNVELLRFSNATVDVDAAGQYGWSVIATFYDAQDRLDWQRVSYDAGNYVIHDWDNSSVNDWSYVSNYYDSQGRLDWQLVSYDAGNYVIHDWDNTGVNDWSYVSNYYDAQGRLDWQQVSKDNGSLVLNGGSGSNQLNGGASADTLDGGAGNDLMSGGSGDDSMFGNTGNDTIAGNTGNDLINGGTGEDYFIFNSVLGSNNVDHIQFYNELDDTILLDAAFFLGIGSAGSILTASSFTVGTAATSIDHRIIFNSATGALSYDGDGNGAGTPVQFAILTEIIGTITNAEFLII